MAWAYTNNPVGRYRTDIGRILCEIANATNEREHFIGKTETVWTGGLGSYPAVTDLDNKNPTSFRTLIAQIRGVIDTDLISYNPLGNINSVKPCDASWNVYATFADLYAVAMGAGTTWAIATANLAGANPVDATLYEEMMKCLELIVRWKVRQTMGYKRDIDSGTNLRATTTLLYDIAVAAGPDDPITCSYEVSDQCGMNPGGLYEDWLGTFYLLEHDKPPAGAPYPTINFLDINYDIEAAAGGEYDLDWYLRTISAAEYAAPAWAGDGTERDNILFTTAANNQTETYGAPAWLGNGTQYLRMDAGTANPFPADPGGYVSTWRFNLDDITTRQSYAGWTYG